MSERYYNIAPTYRQLPPAFRCVADVYANRMLAPQVKQFNNLQTAEDQKAFEAARIALRDLTLTFGIDRLIDSVSSKEYGHLMVMPTCEAKHPELKRAKTRG